MGTACAPMGAGSGREFLLRVYGTPAWRQDPHCGWGKGVPAGPIRDQSFLPVRCTPGRVWETWGSGGPALSLVLFRGERR